MIRQTTGKQDRDGKPIPNVALSAILVVVRHCYSASFLIALLVPRDRAAGECEVLKERHERQQDCDSQEEAAKE